MSIEALCSKPGLKTKTYNKIVIIVTAEIICDNGFEMEKTKVGKDEDDENGNEEANVEDSE